VRRVVRAAVALVIGFVLSTISIEVGHSIRQRQATGTRLGTLDFRAFCARQYGARAAAVSVQPDVWGWRCGTTQNGLYSSHEINVDAACELQYSPPAKAHTSNTSDPYSWECFRGAPPISSTGSP
jgi:hypothetical protein